MFEMASREQSSFSSKACTLRHSPRKRLKAVQPMTPSIDEIPDPARHPLACVACGAPARYYAVLPADGPSRTRGAFALCNESANDPAVLDRLGAMAAEL
jgi:hypothetical protein